MYGRVCTGIRRVLGCPETGRVSTFPKLRRDGNRARVTAPVTRVHTVPGGSPSCRSIENHIPNKPFSQVSYLLKIGPKRNTPAIEQVHFIETFRVQSVTEGLAVDQICKSWASDHLWRNQDDTYFYLNMLLDIDVFFCRFFFSYTVDSLRCEPKFPKFGLLNNRYTVLY